MESTLLSSSSIGLGSLAYLITIPQVAGVASHHLRKKALTPGKLIVDPLTSLASCFTLKQARNECDSLVDVKRMGVCA